MILVCASNNKPSSHVLKPAYYSILPTVRQVADSVITCFVYIYCQKIVISG